MTFDLQSPLPKQFFPCPDHGNPEPFLHGPEAHWTCPVCGKTAVLTDLGRGFKLRFEEKTLDRD